jgi:hypothetical protein
MLPLAAPVAFVGFVLLPSAVMGAVNFSTRRVGGLRFVKLGRLTIMVCLSKEYKPL